MSPVILAGQIRPGDRLNWEGRVYRVSRVDAVPPQAVKITTQPALPATANHRGGPLTIFRGTTIQILRRTTTTTTRK